MRGPGVDWSLFRIGRAPERALQKIPRRISALETGPDFRSRKDNHDDPWYL